MFVVNRNLDDEMPCCLHIVGTVSASKIQVSTLTSDDVFDWNSFDNPDTARIRTNTVSAQPDGLEWVFPTRASDVPDQPLSRQSFTHPLHTFALFAPFVVSSHRLTDLKAHPRGENGQRHCQRRQVCHASRQLRGLWSIVYTLGRKQCVESK